MPDPSSERRARTPLPRDGGQEPGRPARPRMQPRFWMIVLVLLALNYATVSLFAPGKEPEVRVPYAPTFLDQVRDGNVERISSTGTTVSGEFEKAVKYPPGDKEAQAARNFDTEIPTFADTDELDGLLRENNVEISAEPINEGRSALLNVILGFGPVLLLVGLFVY